MEDRTRGILRKALPALALVAAVYVGLIVLSDRDALLAALARLRPAAVALALMLIVAVYAVRSLRWRLYLGRIGAVRDAGPVGFTPAFLMGLPQGKWGQVAKAWALRRRAGTPYGEALPAIFAERVSELGGGLLHLLVGLAIVPGVDLRVVLGALAFLVIAFVALRSRGLVGLLVRSLGWTGFVRRNARAIREAHERLRDHVTARQLSAPATMALAAFLLESLALWALATPGLGLDLGIAEAILILALVDLAATVTFLPGGIGAAEGSLVVLLALEGVPLPDAAALTIVFRAASLWFGIALGAVGVGLLALDARRTAPQPA